MADCFSIPLTSERLVPYKLSSTRGAGRKFFISRLRIMNVYEIMTDRIINHLEEGTILWQRLGERCSAGPRSVRRLK